MLPSFAAGLMPAFINPLTVKLLNVILIDHLFTHELLHLLSIRIVGFGESTCLSGRLKYYSESFRVEIL